MSSSSTLLPLAEMPLIGFGTFIGMESDGIKLFSQNLQTTEEAVFMALQSGYRHIDCAINYGNLEGIGTALTRVFAPISAGGLNLKREEIWITAKGPCDATSLETILKNLGISYVDLYLSHHPVEFENQETLLQAWTVMNRMVHKKMTRFIGVSNQYQEHLIKLLELCKTHHLLTPYANEVEIHPMNQEQKLAAICKSNAIRLIAYSPLGYRNNFIILTAEAILKTAERISATPAQVALAYTMQRGITVIPKSIHADRIKENYAAFSDVKSKLNDADMEKIVRMDSRLSLTATSEEWKAKASALKW